MGFAEYAPCIQHLLFSDNALISSLELQVQGVRGGVQDGAPC